MKANTIVINGIALKVEQVFNKAHLILEGGIEVVKRNGSWKRKLSKEELYSVIR